MTVDEREARLRARLADYGSTLERAAAGPGPAPLRLIAVDGRVGRRIADGRTGDGAGRGGGAGPRGRWSVGRAAAVLVVLAVLAGGTWAATRPSEPTTSTAGSGWADDRWVRPEDRPAAFAALEGTWPLPPGGSLRHTLDDASDASMTFAAYRGQLSYRASCLWFRYAVEQPELTEAERSTIAAMPTWPGRGDDEHVSAVDGFQRVVDATLAGDLDAVRGHLAVNCRGSSEGLGLDEIAGYYLRPGAQPSTSVTPGVTGERGRSIDPATVPGWDALVDRLGPTVAAEGAFVADGVTNLGFDAGGVAFSVTIQDVREPITLPVDEEAFGRGFRLRELGVEVFVGPVGDDATLAVVAGPEVPSVTLSLAAPPDDAVRALGDLVDLAVDVHTAVGVR